MLSSASLALVASPCLPSWDRRRRREQIALGNVVADEVEGQIGGLLDELDGTVDVGQAGKLDEDTVACCLRISGSATPNWSMRLEMVRST